MKIYSASYNFHTEFHWGISSAENLNTASIDYPFLFALREKHIDSITIPIHWSEYEPLKNQYDEKKIESIRVVLSRIQDQNISPIIILNIGDIPLWQNLENTGKADHFSAERYNFATHIINALIPYCHFFCLSFSSAAIKSNKLFKSELITHEEIHDYTNAISESCMVGTLIPSAAFKHKTSGVRRLFGQPSLSELSNMKTDFFGIKADKAFFVELQQLFGNEKKKLLIISDELRASNDLYRADTLIDKIYETWQLYQKGWPILGYCSEVDILSSSPESDLYALFSEQNSLKISTQTPFLSEKWTRFLKD